MTEESEKTGPVCVGMLTNDPLRLEGLRTLLERDGEYRVVALAAGGSETSQMRLAVVDREAATPLEPLVRQMRRSRPQMAILVLGPEAELEQVMAMIGFGVKGYLPYNASEKELRMALDVVREGSIWAPRKVLVRLLDKKAAEPRPPVKLTRREEEVLALLLQGRPNRQIAEALQVDETTVKAHLGRLMRKLGVRNRIALSMQALEKLGPGHVDE